MRIYGSVLAICVIAGVGVPAARSRAAVIWDSTVNGPLSVSGAAPTALVLGDGTNSIISTVGGGSSQNWVEVTIPSGFDLSTLVLGNYQSADAQGFIGIQAGTSFVGSTTSTASYLGYSHFGTGATNGSLPITNLIGSDVLGLMGNNAVGGTAPGSQGFTPPLASGSYVFLIQQLGASTNYQFDFNVGQVPEPGTAALVGVGIGLVMCMRIRRERVS